MMFREKILSQIQVILESVQSIVSQLQHVSQDPNEEQLWWDCQDVQLQCQSISPDNIHENCSQHENSSEINNNVEDEEAYCAVSGIGPLCSDHEDEDHAEVHHALLRAFVEADPEHGGVVTRQSFAHLLDTAADVLAAHGDCAYILEDEDAMQAMFEAVNLSKSGLISYNEWCEFCREHLGAASTTPVSASSNLTGQYTLYFGDEPDSAGDESEETPDQQQPGQNDTVISNLLSCVSFCAPNLIFNPKKSARLKKKKWKKRTKKELHPHLLRMWQHSSELFSPPDAPPATIPAPASPYPVVDWSQVNKRFLGNLPEPTPFPLSGCSPDEKFYRDCDKQGSYTNTRWMLGDAFGSRRGYLTEDGVIAPSAHGQTLHGYVWSDEFRGWVLQTKKKDAKKKVPFNHKQKLERKEKLR